MTRVCSARPLYLIGISRANTVRVVEFTPVEVFREDSAGLPGFRCVVRIGSSHVYSLP